MALGLGHSMGVWIGWDCQGQLMDMMVDVCTFITCYISCIGIPDGPK